MAPGVVEGWSTLKPKAVEPFFALLSGVAGEEDPNSDQLKDMTTRTPRERGA